MLSLERYRTARSDATDTVAALRTACEVLYATQEAARTLVVTLDEMDASQCRPLTAPRTRVLALLDALQRPRVDDPLAWGIALLADRVRALVVGLPFREDRPNVVHMASRFWAAWGPQRDQVEELLGQLLQDAETLRTDLARQYHDATAEHRAAADRVRAFVNAQVRQVRAAQRVADARRGRRS